MKIPYLGKIKLYWCDHCHVPLIRRECGLCKNHGRKIVLSPPGDVRPAFDDDKNRMITAVKMQFGERSANKFEKLVNDEVILLNKAPYIDKMDEIIIQGHVVGVFRYNIIKQDYELLPRVSLATVIWNNDSLHYVDIDIGARIPVINGGSVLSPGVIYADMSISLDDPVIIVCNNEVIAVGLAKMIGIQMGSKNRGVAVKTKYRKKNEKKLVEEFSNSWSEIIKANSHSLNFLEEEALDFIENVATHYKKHVVAYSGGKDSLVTLDLVAQSDVSYEIIFSDTGLEYDETIKNIELTGHKYQRKVHTHKNDQWAFWERFDQFGPPSRNSRWCCKSAKLSPINELLRKMYPEEREVLSFIGRRRYESFGRSKEKRVSRNPWIPQQVTASPISDWNAFEVFLYIQKHRLNELLNPLYESGFVRVGCWLCPASSMSDFHIMKHSHPLLLAKLNKKLVEYQKKNNLPYQYITWGLWRWKYLPKKVLNLLKSKQLDYQPPGQRYQELDDLVFRITSTPSPCIHGGFTALLSANQILDLSRLSLLLPILGSVQYIEDLDILSVKTNNHSRIDIFRDGSIVIKNPDEKKMEKEISNLIQTVYRIKYCDGCGVCTHQCLSNGLIIKSGLINTINENCNSCLKCNKYCPLIKYRDLNLIQISDNEIGKNPH
ncbi:MAG: phosphoadenosine phosphosulfate reductase domain-containing protein [Candidatus Hodarchaeales archaeon]